MIIPKPGAYRLFRDYVIRPSSICIGTIGVGSIIHITQVDKTYRKVIGPELRDWHHWDLPVEEIQQDNQPDPD